MTDRKNIQPKDHQIVTIQHHILSEQRKRFPQASGAFSWLLSAITLATKMTQAKVARAGLSDVIGAVGRENIQGEEQQKLDVFANNALIHCLGVRENVAIIASEENEEPITFDGRSGPGKYIVLFDPLDGSSNIDVNVSVGTIFSIFALPEEDRYTDANSAVLQRGAEQLAAGYVVYGSSTIMVYTTGHGVHGFTLDPAVGEYVLSHENIRMPTEGSSLFLERRLLGHVPRRVPGLHHAPAFTVKPAASTRSATSARWSPTSTARYSAAASSCIRPPSHIPTASSGSSTKPTPSPSSPNKPAASPSTATSGSSPSPPPRSTSGHRW